MVYITSKGEIHCSLFIMFVNVQMYISLDCILMSTTVLSNNSDYIRVTNLLIINKS